MRMRAPAWVSCSERHAAIRAVRFLIGVMRPRNKTVRPCTVRGGVGCVACHGRVDQMARVYKVAPLNMGWCLDCHQNAEEWVKTSRPSAVARLASLGEVAPATDQPALWGTFPTELVAHGSLGPKKLDALTTCTACHR